MKVFKSNHKNLFYFFYRVIYPIFDPIWFAQGIKGYVWFARDLILYKVKDKKAKLLNTNLFPILFEKTPYLQLDYQYFYQQLWIFDNVLKKKPKLHVDIASSYQLSGYLSKIVKTEFVELRPIKVALKNLKVRKGDLLNLPYKNNSVESLSCMSVIEHIGLGRYGDKIDPQGTEKACRELKRILAKNGYLYISVPISKKNKICFNAHRLYEPETIIKLFSGLKLLSYSLVDDDGEFYQNTDLKKFKNIDYGCGMFLFTKLNN